ncbi:ribosome assembly RNA-binding protein YhbY [Kangiella taiwanensis]|uniref:Ribosome assembly RNA-binding protein YhbY n=1 Tax=Kangiella taiwanensis TaxID=1079179 RepID=A0ABP8HVB7_9GAMM|nr:ribosome assembly RNA-binding protein YhbY [Kangiella taiwanensis]
MSQSKQTPLSKTQIKFLRSKAHNLKPVVMIGDKGLTENVLEEINLALNHHELIKIKVRAEEREDKKAIIEAICKETKGQEVQVIGHILALYRRSDDVKIILPK